MPRYPDRIDSLESCLLSFSSMPLQYNTTTAGKQGSVPVQGGKPLNQTPGFPAQLPQPVILRHLPLLLVLRDQSSYNKTPI